MIKETSKIQTAIETNVEELSKHKMLTHTQRGFYSKVWLNFLFKLVASHLYLIIVFIFLWLVALAR